MDDVHALASLDEPAREELAEALEGMARDAADLSMHAILPYTLEMLNRRRLTCLAAAAQLRDVAA
jgi:hypothetical protein